MYCPMMPDDLVSYIVNVRAKMEAFGFGISKANTVSGVAEWTDGVVGGSAIVKAMDDAVGSSDTTTEAKRPRRFSPGRGRWFEKWWRPAIRGGHEPGHDDRGVKSPSPGLSSRRAPPTFGKFGGQHIPETLSVACPRSPDCSPSDYLVANGSGEYGSPYWIMKYG
jgi:Tryptophan synthase alpha chain